MEQSKAITKRKRKKSGFIHKLKRFLASDSHMFAPLLSSSSSFVATPGFFRNDLFGGREKRFLDKVDDYLISDMHMYAALVSPQPITPHLDASTRVWYTRKLTTEITTQKMTVENRQWPGRNSIQQNDEGKDSAMGTSQNQSTQDGTSRKRTVYRNGHIPPS